MERIFRPASGARSGWMWLLAGSILAIALLPIFATVRTAWGVGTLRYELTPTELVVPYAYKRTVIPRAAITSVTQVTPTGGIRVMGTGMPGLQEGRWRFDETGPITMYSRSTSPLTVIETPTGKWGISPADPAGFHRALAGGQTGIFPPVQVATSTGGLTGLALVGILVPVGVGVLILYLIRAARQMTYTLTESGVLIRLAWSRVEIPYVRITGVRLDSPRGMPLRLFGTGMPGLHWGSFAWKAAGKRVRLYATRLRPLVLIDAAGVTYGITPEAGEEFVQELQQRLV